MTAFPLSRRTVLKMLGAATAGTVGAGMIPGASSAATLTAPLRDLGATVGSTPVASIENARYKIAFYQATFTGGSTYVHDLSIKVGASWKPLIDTAKFVDEQWVVLTGSAGNPDYYYDTMDEHWIAFDQLTHTPGTKTVTLTSTVAGIFDLSVVWTLAGVNPEAQWSLTARRADHFVVGLQAFDVVGDSAVTEVLCGSRQHSKVVLGNQSLSGWEMMAPMALTERAIGGQACTVGVYIPATRFAFEHERKLGPQRQRFGMSLRNNDFDVQPIVFAPQVGVDSSMAANTTRSFAFGVYANTGSLYSAYSDLTANEYDYRDYRRNLGSSLTAAMYNLIDLVLDGPDKTSSNEQAASDIAGFTSSPSGWWPRARGFANIEEDHAVRTATAGVLLSAYQLTQTPNLYEKRALPLMQYHVSRGGPSWTPVLTNPSVGKNKICEIAGDASTLVPLYLQSRGQSAAFHELALQVIKSQPLASARTPMSTPLQAYELTGNPAYLTEAVAAGLRLTNTEIMPGYTKNIAESGFQYNYAKAWTELFRLSEFLPDGTTKTTLRTAAITEARRFITQMQVRPVPAGTITITGSTLVNDQIERWVGENSVWNYPTTTVPNETVDAWMVSTNGIAFEQLTTLKFPRQNPEPANPGGGYSQAPAWAPFLLRLGSKAGDTLMKQVAHNLAIGRYTSYPGYYNRNFVAWTMHPGFPTLGPPGIGAIYYNHLPAMLGLTMDYLISEQYVRSQGTVTFPAQFEDNYVFFKFHTYGHASGSFYGLSAWLYMPKGIVSIANSQINWVTAEHPDPDGTGQGAFYLSMTNETDTSQTATVVFDTARLGISASTTYTVSVKRGAADAGTAQVVNGQLSIVVPAKGHTAIILRGVTINNPMRWSTGAIDRTGVSYRFHSAPNARAMLIVRPDRTGYHAYVQAATTTAGATLTYSLNGGTATTLTRAVYPYEWTIPVTGLATKFTYTLAAPDGTATDTLFLPASVSGVDPDGTAISGEVSTVADTTGGDTIRVRARLRNRSSTALSGVTLGLTLPSGWTSTTITSHTSVPAQDNRDWQFDVTVPVGASTGVSLGATATWVGGSRTLVAAQVGVILPVIVSAVTPASPTLANPGQQTTVKVSVLNVSPVSRSVSFTLAGPSGWTVSAGAGPITLAPRNTTGHEYTHTFTVTSSASAGRETTHVLTAAVTETTARGTGRVWIAPAGILVDNADRGYSELGWWNPSSLNGWNSTDSRYANGSSTNPPIAIWRPSLPAAGTYRVLAWFPSDSNTTTSATYRIHYAGGAVQTISGFNQQAQGRQWVALGDFSFATGTAGYVELVANAPGAHRADALRFLAL